MKQNLAIFILSFFIVTSCAQSSKNDYLVTIKTSKGTMYAILYDETPLHKKNFIELAEKHFFDSLLFHRVIPGFMIQGGDPNSKKSSPGQHLGMGGPGYTVPAEFNPELFHVKGALSAARLGDQQNPKKESSGSQFYIVQGTVMTQADFDNLGVDQNKLMTGLRQMFQDPANKPLLDSLQALYYSGDMAAYQKRLTELAPRVEKFTNTKIVKPMSEARKKVYSTIGGAPHLDDDYTVFGKVIKGLEVIDQIAAVSRDGVDRPTEDIRMFITVEEMSKKKITKEFGYVYPEKKK